MDPQNRTDRPRVEQLLGLTQVLYHQQSPDRVLALVLEAALRLLRCRYAAIGILSASGQVLERFETAGLSPEEIARIGSPPRGHGILGLLIRDPRVIRLADLGAHPDSVGFPPHHPPMTSFLGVPITGRRGVFGNLYVTERQGGGEFTEEDAHVALLLANAAGSAIENAMLHEESARLLEEVQQLQRRRERFFATVNHELRNALAAAFGWAEMLTRRIDRSQGPRAAFEVLDATEQAVGIINDLLDLSRLDEDRLRLEMRAVESGALAQRAVAHVLPMAETKAITVEPMPTAGIRPVRTDSHRVEQILTNLLVNAIRHAPEGSRVRVDIGESDDRVLIAVVDEGPGVAPTDHERIFNIYETRPGDGGVGLGLPLSRRLAELLGGSLYCDPSHAPGARFVLELPRTGES